MKLTSLQNNADSIKVKVICVFSNAGRILLGNGFDPSPAKFYLRPLGGSVDFGEPHHIAIQREIMEELGFAIKNLVLLGVIENFFNFDNKPGHEIIFVYDAEFIDSRVYIQDNFQCQESDGSLFKAQWLELSTIDENTPPIYPDGLLKLLNR